MVFAQSKQKNINKIYTPKIIEILEKYNSDNDSVVLKIILYSFLIIFALVLITIIIIFIKKKKQKIRLDNENNIDLSGLNNLDKLENGQDNNRLIDDTISINENENIELPTESEVYKKGKNLLDYIVPPP